MRALYLRRVRINVGGNRDRRVARYYRPFE